MPQRAFFIAVEGIDGSGKGTQSARLCERLRQAGKSVKLFSFPRYSETFFGRLVGEFLNGAYGTLEQVHPQLVSLLFAGDRFESRGLLQQALETQDVVVCDRYVPSNVAHQASKRNGIERAELSRRILQIEYEIFALPRPDLVLLLDMPADRAQQLVAKKAARTYTTQTADIQEADGGYLRGVREVYLDLARSEANWQLIAGCHREELRSLDEIGSEVWDVVSRRL